MTESSNLQTVVIPLLTAALTLGGTVWLQGSQNDRADHTRLLDNAQATAQETSVLLNDGYNALSKLVHASGRDGWEKFSAGPWKDYREFERHWRQQLITEHFKLARYFGKELADQIVHVDEIDLHPVNNLSSPNPCTPPGGKSDFDIDKLADQTDCVTRLIAQEQDMLAKPPRKGQTDDSLDIISAQKEREEFTERLLESYDKSAVALLRQLDSQLSAMGQQRVEIVHR